MRGRGDGTWEVFLHGGRTPTPQAPDPRPDARIAAVTLAVPVSAIFTPESLALLLSYEDAPRIFSNLSRVIVDEIHALAESKRGDQLMLCLSRLATLSPQLRRVGLSATPVWRQSLDLFILGTGIGIAGFAAADALCLGDEDGGRARLSRCRVGQATAR